MHKTQAVLRAIQRRQLTTIIKEINKQPIAQMKSKQSEQLYKNKQQELEKITAVTDNLEYGDITKAEYLRMKAKFDNFIYFSF